MFANKRKRSQRRGWPISFYVGPNGSGKSACMVWDTLPSLAAGRPVLSTVRLLDWTNPRACQGCDEPGHLRPVYGPVDLSRFDLEASAQAVEDELLAGDLSLDDLTRPDLARDANGFPLREVVDWITHGAAHPLWVPFTAWEQLLEARGCDVLMDEVTGVASSRESQSLPAPVANTLVQLRRRDVVMRCSAPAWARADLIIREVAQAVTHCQGYLPKHAGGTDRLWRQRRMFKWQTFDATLFEDFTSGKREELRPMVTDWHWGPRSPVFSAYDTFDSVSSITTVTEGGSCYRCGGRRSRPTCKCGDSHGDQAATPAHEKGRGPARGVPVSSAGGRLLGSVGVESLSG